MIDVPRRTMRFEPSTSAEFPPELLDGEWLVTNGIGGYASGSLSGTTTRRFHGMLVAALPAPHGRVLMLARLYETLTLAGGADQVGERVLLGAPDLNEHDEPIPFADGDGFVPRVVMPSEFELEGGLPIWRYVIGATTIEKRVLMPHMQNTTHVMYAMTGGEGAATLHIRPAICFRGHEARVDTNFGPYEVRMFGDRYEIVGDASLPPLRLFVRGRAPSFILAAREFTRSHRIERTRGYDHVGPVASPGLFSLELATTSRVVLTASVDSWDAMLALTPEAALEAEHVRRQRLLEIADPRVAKGIGAELVLAADQFIIAPRTRTDDSTRARAEGDEARSVIAGYPWFTDWGRDTMISLEGLTLLTGRHEEAGYILRTFAHYVRDGLVPNMFPEGQSEGMYHTCDAAPWFFHALARYVDVTGDRNTLCRLLPLLCDMADAHLRGTRFGIGVDPDDGLLREGSPEHPLTWMDAKVDGWIVTPRRGKPVEINALFYNALRLLSGWLRENDEGSLAAPYEAAAERLRISFNTRFWNPKTGYLFDIVDGENGDDPACRPNQLFSIGLPHPVLDPSHWAAVVDVCEQSLVTPVGLRSLAPGHPDYKSHYFGDLRSRDAAYHQGTVWAWLIGPFADAWRRVHPEDHEEYERMVLGFAEHLGEACIGSVSEIFDAEAPYLARGCHAQAWSVAELLRCVAMTQPK